MWGFSLSSIHNPERAAVSTVIWLKTVGHRQVESVKTSILDQPIRKHLLSKASHGVELLLWIISSTNYKIKVLQEDSLSN